MTPHYTAHTLPNGLRIIHLPTVSPVSYCGFAVNAGTRDETIDQFGLAHFVEHTLFKGTQKRKSWHILNRMENVGGELNAYTTKEETFIYSVCLSDDIERAMELLSDLVFNSRFPDAEIDKEREVVIDEINSYRDNPAELIYDEFENLLFRGNEFGHSILGDEASLNTFTSASCRTFVDAFYHPDNMIFFFYGQTPFNKIIRLAKKYFVSAPPLPYSPVKKRITPRLIPAVTEQRDKDLHQAHLIIGSQGFSLHDPRRIGLYFLNNLLGGPGMNSRLNLALREKHGLVYTVESGLGSYSDTGVFDIYFACDPKDIARCTALVHKELKKLRDNALTTSQFHTAVKQLKGQLGVASDHKESIALGMGKSFLHFNKYDSLEDVYRKIDALSPAQLQAIAQEVWDENRLSQLTFV
ncbi:MAG: insulinase family protein [Candidatus Symbiothrix sp.]|jgi:predicted Zn-dependent peptidase|nr:insulinase family protein [Candidatus Symbiothrix sp.]